MNYMETKGVIEELSKRLDRKSTDVSSLIDGSVSIIKEKCGNLDSIAIPGFGNFIPVKKEEHIAEDENGKRIMYPPSVELKFESSAILKSKLLEEGGSDEK
jgi:DNA-binding protein HU-beta